MFRIIHLTLNECLIPELKLSALLPSASSLPRVDLKACCAHHMFSQAGMRVSHEDRQKLIYLGNVRNPITTLLLLSTMTAISSRTVSSPARQSSLPQYGFGVDYTFQTLAEHNSFLFRVHTPNGRSPVHLQDDYFVAGKFEGSPIQELPKSHSLEDVASHLDLMTRSSSPYISTSFSFAWSLWEALRRYRLSGGKDDLEIAVIDSRQVLDRAITVTDVLRACPSQERPSEYWDWYQFSLESQDVFIYGSVPKSAVLTSIPLRLLAGALPTYYFLSNIAPDSSSDLRLEGLMKDHAHHQATYSQFCRDISSRFQHMSDQEKLCESTTGAVHLALGFLRPWFAKVVIKDHDFASAVVNDLASAITQWPAKYWVTERPEIFDMIESISHLIGLEARREYRDGTMKELVHLQGVISGLEQDVGEYVRRRNSISESSEGTVVGEEYEPKQDTLDTLPLRRTSSLTEAIVTGFLFGAVITFCMISSQRRYISNQFY
jgi:hypothetical protein